jgi:hypothetical protein
MHFLASQDIIYEILLTLASHVKLWMFLCLKYIFVIFNLAYIAEYMKWWSFWSRVFCHLCQLNYQLVGWKSVDVFFAWYLIHAGFCVAYSSILKAEVTRSFKMSADFQQATSHYIPVDRTLHNHHCENVRSCIVMYHSVKRLRPDVTIRWQLRWLSFSLCRLIHNF